MITHTIISNTNAYCLRIMKIITIYHNLCIFITGTELIRGQDLRARDVNLHRSFALHL